MIKSFKDFDTELKGQRIYEDIGNMSDKNKPIFTEKDIIVPEMISDNKYLLKISRIVLRKLEKSGIGDFGVHPVIVTIDGVPGVYFYNLNNPTMNIVICRNVNGKHAYLFNEFNIGVENVANLVLSTTKLGFNDIIDQLIYNLTSKSIDEGLICEWVEGIFNYSEDDVEKVANLPVDIRQTIVDLLNSDYSAPAISRQILNNNTVEPFATLYDAIKDIYGRVHQGNIRKVIDIFDKALKKKTNHDELFNVLNDCTLVSRKSRVVIDESLICEWVEGSYNYSEKDIDKIIKLDADVRQIFIDLLNKNSANAVAKNIFNNPDEPFSTLYSVIEGMYGKINQSNTKKVVDVFDRALNKLTNHIEVYDVLEGCELESTAITTSKGVTIKADSSLTEASKKIKEAELEKDFEEYSDTLDDIYKLASAMCKYVKSNGDSTYTDLSGLVSRGMLITGTGGSGKSESVKRALDDNRMILNRDYYEMSSSSTAVKSLYKKFYDYNGKLLIFDDSGDLFGSEYKLSFWKQAMQTKQSQANVALTQNTGTSSKTVTNNTYATDKVKNRQERYFLEIGQSSHEEKDKFYTKERDKRRKSFIADGGGYSGITKKLEKEWDEEIDAIWNKMEEDKEPLMPDIFNYKGVVIIISNETVESFQKTVGFDNWTAINRRFANFDLHPFTETLWAKIKEILLKQRDMSDSELPDKMCMIPRDDVDEFIEEVEHNFENPETRNMNFSIVADTMHTAFSGPEGRSTWRRTLKRYMKTLPSGNRKK